jgi:hypothetical protein
MMNARIVVLPSFGPSWIVGGDRTADQAVVGRTDLVAPGIPSFADVRAGVRWHSLGTHRNAGGRLHGCETSRRRLAAVLAEMPAGARAAPGLAACNPTIFRKPAQDFASELKTLRESYFTLLKLRHEAQCERIFSQQQRAYWAKPVLVLDAQTAKEDLGELEHARKRSNCPPPICRCASARLTYWTVLLAREDSPHEQSPTEAGLVACGWGRE